jgi:hypothetical protein
MANEVTTPTQIPMKPPARERARASTRNWDRMSRPPDGLADADQLERQAADVDGRADRVLGQAQVVRGGGSDDRHSQLVLLSRVVWADRRPLQCPC